MIQVKIFYAENDLRNFSYLVINRPTADCWVIDPFEARHLIDYIKKESLVLRGILNTHQHWDHIRGNSELQSVFKCSVIAHTTHELPLGLGQSITVLDTPGHTVDHQAFVLKKGDRPIALFSGDTLFNSGVGNCKNGGNVDVLFDTTMKLKSLPDDVIIYPGHDYVLRNLLFAQSCEPGNIEIEEGLRSLEGMETQKGLAWTLGQEKKINPFLRLNSKEIRQILIGAEENFENEIELERSLFKKLRYLRDHW